MMARHKLKIISGGQTGVDRGALDAALATGIPCGGWCPAGRKAEDGPISEKYPLKETASEQYIVRTRQNVIDSDGTLLIYFGSLEGGTARTLEFCRELNKPIFCLDADQYSPAQAARLIKLFLEEHNITALNVAGPRASKQPHAESYAREAIRVLINLHSPSTEAL